MANLAAILAGRAKRRAGLVELQGSPNFRHTFGAIASGASEMVDLFETFPASQKYLPLEALVITNNGAADLDLEINGRNYLFVPAGVIQSITDEAIYSFRLSNNDAVAAASGAVRANASTPPLTIDKAIRRG